MKQWIGYRNNLGHRCFAHFSPDLSSSLQAVLAWSNFGAFIPSNINIDIVWRNVEKMCYKAIENLWNVLDFSRRNKIFYRIISIREYICPLMFVQVWSSVLKNILNPTEIGNNNSFSVSVTIGVEFELYQHVKKYSHFGKNFCGYPVKKQYWWQWSRPPWCWWKRYCV